MTTMPARILVVDDEQDITTWLTRYLRRAGYEVVPMHDSLQAWEAFQARPFDLVITDLRMPDLDGAQLTERIKAQAPRTQVVVLTGHGAQPDIQRLVKLGVAWVLHKPLRDANDLVALVNQLIVLDRRTAELIETRDLFDQTLAAMSDGLFIIDLAGAVVRVNQAALALLETNEAQILGQPFAAICPDQELPCSPQQLLELAPEGRLIGLETRLRNSVSGADLLVNVSCAVMRDMHGAPSGVLTLVHDTGELHALAETVNALSSPVVPIFDRMLVLPLIGFIDSFRSQQITAGLLEGIQTHQAEVAIIDITGVPLVDTRVANHLVQAIRAAEMLGARCLLVGIRPEIAVSLVSLGAALGDIQACVNLQEGVQRGLQLLGLELRPRSAPPRKARSAETPR